MTQRRKQQSGYTLVEIAIVLVIIGLLLGGVLKGQELIYNQKVKSTYDNVPAVHRGHVWIPGSLQGAAGR